VSDRGLIEKVEGTWQRLEELAGETEILLGKEAPVA
jgi:hypothetical protein